MATGDVRARRRRARRRRAVVAVGLVVAVGVSVATAAAVDGVPLRWQIGEAAIGSVTQTIESSGTISAASKATPSFAVSGTVKSVEVTVGQTVAKGDNLAELDTTTLQSAVDSAKSTLASAQQKLESDKTGQTTVGGTSVAPTAYEGSSSTVEAAIATTTGSTVLIAATVTGSGAATQQVQAAQAAVIAAQKDVDSDQTALDAAQKPVDDDIRENLKLSDAQKQACAATTAKRSDSSNGLDASSSADGSTSKHGSSRSTKCTEAQANYEASASRLADDMKALDAAITAQDKAVAALDDAISKLDAAIKDLQSTSTGSGGSTGGSGTGGTGGTGTPKGGTGGGSQTGKTPNSAKPSTAKPSTAKPSGGATTTAKPASAAQLAADQASIDSAEASVTEAKQNLAAATLTSPISGRVAAVGFTAGESASGETISIVGVGVQKVSSTVPLSRVDLVKKGQAVTIAVDGVAATLHGAVTSIGMLSTTTGSTTSFPVTITLDDEQPNLYDGTGADVVITTGTAKNVVTVPNSALHAGPRGTYTVTVLNNGATTTKTVTIGVAGPDATEVNSGLAAGDQVVLADLNEQLPSSTTSTTNSRTGGFGNFGGFGGPAGFPGGR
jgi:trimeric autotransporter adhesin